MTNILMLGTRPAATVVGGLHGDLVVGLHGDFFKVRLFFQFFSPSPWITVETVLRPGAPPQTPPLRGALFFLFL